MQVGRQEWRRPISARRPANEGRRTRRRSWRLLRGSRRGLNRPNHVRRETSIGESREGEGTISHSLSLLPSSSFLRKSGYLCFALPSRFLHVAGSCPTVRTRIFLRYSPSDLVVEPTGLPMRILWVESRVV